MLSKYCKEIADKYDIKVGDVKKLIPNLSNKTKYVLYYRNLQLYLSLGMKVTTIHRVLKFKQSGWMKKYIDFNTKKRMSATNDFEKYFFNLMINSAYGKTMENLVLNKPIYVGFTVLDLSKWLVYDFHYNFVKKNFNVELFFTDTDSLTYEIKSENIYKEFCKWKDLFDCSNYSKDSTFYDDTNKKLYW